MARVLLTGATGFVGARLHDRLCAAGWRVRCLTRRPDAARERWPRREWVGGDVGDPTAVAVALRGCRSAMYLVHGVGDGRGWARREVRAAESFARAAEQAGLERIVYLGGVAPSGAPSEHLRARLETGEALRAGAVPCLELRAAMIVGEGSASWTIVRDLAARLPAMLLPAWLAHRSEPVAVDDVIAALVAATRIALPRSTWWDLPGPEALSGKEILLRVAAVMGRKPTVLDVPVVTPWLSSQWIRAVTRANPALARELVEGLTSDLLATRPGFWDAARIGPRMRLEEAARRAIRAEWNLPWRWLAWELATALVTPRVGRRA